MAFRFTFTHEDKPIETDWYVEQAVFTAPMLIGTLRAIFPDAEIATERANRLDAKEPDMNQVTKDFLALKT